MKAIVLVGGLGTRLRPLTFAVPKPLLAVGKKPILQLIIEQLKAAGCDEVILATGYLGELIETFCGDGRKFGISVTYAREQQPLGTAGPVALVRDRIARDEFFLLMNGDLVTDLNFLDLLTFSRQHDYPLTVAYVAHSYRLPFGVLTLEDKEVVAVTEKPQLDHLISSGIYVLKGSALDYIPDGQFFTIPDLIQKLRSCGLPVGAYPIEGFWLSVEQLGDLETASRFLERVRAPDSDP